MAMKDKTVICGRMPKDLQPQVLAFLERTGSTDSKLVNCALLLALPVLETRLKNGEPIYPELDPYMHTN